MKEFSSLEARETKNDDPLLEVAAEKTGIPKSKLEEVRRSPKLRKYLFAMLLSMGLSAPLHSFSQQTGKNAGSPETEQGDSSATKEGQTFENNDWLQNDIRTWVHYIKKGEIVENEGGGWVSAEMIDRIMKKDQSLTYHEASELAKKEVDSLKAAALQKFLDVTRDVSPEEVRKVYDFLLSRMDVWNMSDLFQFETDLTIVDELTKAGDIRAQNHFYSKKMLKDVDIEARGWSDEGDQKIAEAAGVPYFTVEDEAFLLFHAIKKIVHEH